MVVNMLRAVQKMLAHTDTMVALTFQARVACAEEMLSEIIKGMEDKPIELNTKPTPQAPIPPPEKKEGQYFVTVNEDKTFKLIKGLPLDSMLLVDGKNRVKHEDLIGKKFNKVQIL